MSAAREIWEIAWLRHGHPLPPGWEVAPQRLGTHHNYYSILIRRRVPEGGAL